MEKHETYLYHPVVRPSTDAMDQLLEGDQIVFYLGLGRGKEEWCISIPANLRRRRYLLTGSEPQTCQH